MSALRKSIAVLAEEFASAVVNALTGASLSDLAGLSAAAPARAMPKTASQGATAVRKLPRTRKGGRRSKADQQKIVDALVTALASNKAGMKSEELQQKLRLSKKDLVRPIATALATNAIKKKGVKRGTTYFVG